MNNFTVCCYFPMTKLAISSMFLVTIILMPSVVASKCTCDFKASDVRHNNTSSRSDQSSSVIRYKVVAVASVLVAGAIGISIPLVGRRFEALRPENDIFFMIKAFAAGVILATGFIHMLPDAFRSLSSPCLPENPWRKFPFGGFVAMMSAIGTLMVDSFATHFYNRIHHHQSSSSDKPHQQQQHLNNAGFVVDSEICRGDDDHDQQQQQQQQQHVGGHVHVHGSATIPPHLIRQRIISQVLELGILVHSVIIGVSLGASERLETIKPLLAALCFHQFFEGMGLGGCISQAKFKSLWTVIMALFFSFTTPVGIVIGIGVSRIYDENSPTALIVEGIFGSASAGILIYMALVDLLAQDFMNPRLLTNVRLQLGAYVSLLLGTVCMSFLARWA